MNYRLIPMTAEHVPQVAALERTCFSHPWTEDMLRQELWNDAAVIVVAEGEDGTVLGYAGLQAVLDEGYINNVAVDPRFRRQGVADELIAAFVRFGKAKLAFLTLEDLVGSVEVMVFPRDYEKWQNMINEDARVFIQGRVSAEDDKASKLILEKVRSFSDIPRELWIQFESKDDYSQKEKGLLEDLRNSQGTDTVVIYLKDVKAMKKLSAAYHVNLQDEWLAQMSKKYGEGNIRVVERALKTL